ncbi:hypothetical protein SAMN06297144_1691 [Sphingomonas guangdongensis]|uniref:Uncharacterized protein n=1 Tax=Sphingomonas guangdongensis TaxID=1141890 RepID=A0A285QX86_9SPHN|nr:hypothetical protein [Sphingomonas guangdongensis]SOB86585.1 hypothetical protein SAMN06297144_1691 [Sphingomonas guangdongensis]
MRPSLTLVPILGLLAGCGTAATPVPQPSTTASIQEEASGGVGYAACRARADGDPSLLQRCADEAVTRLTTGDRAAATYRAALRALGDDALDRGVFGDGAAARVAVADAAVALSQARAAWLAGGAAPRGAGDPSRLGNAARQAWSESRAATCSITRVSNCAARYDALLAAFQPAEERTDVTEPVPASGLPLPTCAEVRQSALVGGALGDAFYQRYPKELADPARVDGVALNGAALANVVGYLACVATLTDYDPVVAENSLALFESPVHGRAAFARLTALAEEPGAEASGRETFLKQLRAMTKAPRE